MPVGEMESRSAADGRYRTLLEVSGAIASQPNFVDVRLFKNFNVATTNLMFLMLGAALFSSTVLMPQLLQTLMGYTAQKAGMVLSAGALVVLFPSRLPDMSGWRRKKPMLPPG
jgi:hypothetical protein